MTTQQLATTTPLEKLTWSWRGHKILYTVKGTGLPLVLIHGFGASIGHWRKNIPALAEGGYRVYALDLLGFGGSDKPPLDYTLDLWAELLKDFWNEHIQEPAVFVGNSIGGLLSLMVVAHHPEIAAGAILLNCAGGLNHRPHELNLPLRLVMGAFTKVVQSQLIGPILFNSIRQKQRIRNTLLQVYRNSEAITDELVDMLYAPSCDPGAQKVFASILTAPPGPTIAELLPKVKHPVLVLWGADDPWTPVKGAQIFQERNSNGEPIEFISIPNTGHCPHDERPDVVNPLMLDWLAKL
ncbi:MAG TPA: alpha/beta hydrolase [Cyanobacteria bacterium UBA11372]|nr:alpha/beta hydrolase [Cyanobacteria bacterium UBA11372]